MLRIQDPPEKEKADVVGQELDELAREGSRAAHTDLMDDFEQVFDEPVVWRQSAQRDPRGKIRSDGNSRLDSPRS